MAWYRSPREVVTSRRLERYSEAENPLSAVRVRLNEIKRCLGTALGVHFGANWFKATLIAFSRAGP